MANSNNFDFLSLGEHCSLQSCNRLDYLPFKCDFCQGAFCLNHKEPSNHSCAYQLHEDSKLQKCPICQSYIVKGTDRCDDNTQLERHIKSDCKELTMKKRKKNRCGFARCREINLIPLHCNKCFQSFCVRHRHPDDHTCSQYHKTPLVCVR